MSVRSLASWDSPFENLTLSLVTYTQATFARFWVIPTDQTPDCAAMSASGETLDVLGLKGFAELWSCPNGKLPGFLPSGCVEAEVLGSRLEGWDGPRQTWQSSQQKCKTRYHQGTLTLQELQRANAQCMALGTRILADSVWPRSGIWPDLRFL